MALEPSISEDTVESEDIDLAALMKRYQGSLSVSISGEEYKSLSLKEGESADSDFKKTDDYYDLDEDEYAARANEIMQRYKMQYAPSDDTEQSSESSVAYNAKEEESNADADEAETFRECIEDRAEELMNKSRQILELSEMDGRKEKKEVEVVDAGVVDLVENAEIGEEMGSKVEYEIVEEDVLEQVEPRMLEEEEIQFESESGTAEEEESEFDELFQLETETGSAEKDDLDEVEIGEEIQEEEVEAMVEASNTSAVSTSISATKVEASSNDADESEDLEEMITKLTLENEALKRKKELKKRIYELSQENDKLKMCTQRNALANIAIKFDDAVTNAVSKVSKIMVCAPDDADIFEEGFPEMSEGDENGDSALVSERFGRRLEYKQVEVLSPISHITENTNYFQSVPASPNSYQLKMQAYNKKHRDPIKPNSSVSVNDALEEARLASGVSIDDGLDDALRRVEEAKRYIKNRSELKEV
eukprot:scaffold2745_cov137-Skeletonema_menzelii.AAC.5